MNFNYIEEIENFWVGLVKGSMSHGRSVTRVPLNGLGRQTAAKLAAKLNVMVFIKGTDYLFTTSLQEVLD